MMTSPSGADRLPSLLNRSPRRVGLVSAHAACLLTNATGTLGGCTGCLKTTCPSSSRASRRCRPSVCNACARWCSGCETTSSTRTCSRRAPRSAQGCLARAAPRRSVRLSRCLCSSIRRFLRSHPIPTLAPVSPQDAFLLLALALEARARSLGALPPEIPAAWRTRNAKLLGATAAEAVGRSVGGGGGDGRRLRRLTMRGGDGGARGGGGGGDGGRRLAHIAAATAPPCSLGAAWCFLVINASGLSFEAALQLTVAQGLANGRYGASV